MNPLTENVVIASALAVYIIRAIATAWYTRRDSWPSESVVGLLTLWACIALWPIGLPRVVKLRAALREIDNRTP